MKGSTDKSSTSKADTEITRAFQLSNSCELAGVGFNTDIVGYTAYMKQESCHTGYSIEACTYVLYKITAIVVLFLVCAFGSTTQHCFTDGQGIDAEIHIPNSKKLCVEHLDLLSAA